MNAIVKHTSEIAPNTTFVVWNCRIAKSKGTTSKAINPIADVPP